MTRIGLWVWIGCIPVWAGELPEKAANYHEALVKRPESAALFERFRDAWLEERSADDLEKELLSRAAAGEAGAWAILGRARLMAGKPESALEAFVKAREQSPAAWLDLETAKLRLAARDFAAAEKEALSVPEGDARRPEALKLAGLACLRGERVDEALAYWSKAVAAAPGDKGLLEDLTELTRREGRLDLALEFCGKWRDATDEAYGKAMATLRRSDLLLASQRFDEAVTDLAGVLDRSGDGSWLEREAMARAEQAHRQRGNVTGWATWIGARADEHPTRLGFRRAQAQALASTGKTDEALEVLAEVMKRSPGDTVARWQRVDLLERAMRTARAYEECKALADEEKSETAGLRLAELAFRLEKKDEVKRALDYVLAAADPAKRVSLAGLYARYGLPKESERVWREAANGELGGQALRELAKHLRAEGRDREAIEAWKQLGARDVAQDRIEAAQMLAAAGEREAARGVLTTGPADFLADPGRQGALAELELMDDKADEARKMYLGLARAAKRPDELVLGMKGWLRAVAAAANPLEGLGDETADRCLRAAWLAESDKPLPELRQGDELERSMRLSLLREHGKWAEVVSLMESLAGERGPLFLSDLTEAKTAAGDLPGAMSTARTWRERVPDQPAPWLRGADILDKLGRQNDAIQLLRRASGRFEDNEDVARRLFGLLEDSPDPREALEWAWKRHDRSEDQAARSTWLREILRVSKDRQQLEDLQERFAERARRDPASPGPLLALAELAKARGESREELDFLRRAAVNAPQDAAVISALATLEERSGETARALERFAGLAKLSPGPDSARQLAQAKIRLGDIEGGMRDLQKLAGEKGIDLRALEQSAGDLAARGYVEEAIRMLTAVDPQRRDARLHFVLGMLLETDGREAEAVDAFLKVMAEPDDPAESKQRAAHGYTDSPQTGRLLLVLQANRGRGQRMPGTFIGLQIPESLVSAKMQVQGMLSRTAIQRGGEFWSKATGAIPELAAATLEQWREALAFVGQDARDREASWWDFIQKHPDNPLGPDMLVDSGQISQGTPDQVEALLKSDAPFRIRMLLRSSSSWRADNLAFLESIDAASWRDETVRRQALRMVGMMFYQSQTGGAGGEVTDDECQRGLALVVKAGFQGPEEQAVILLEARFALQQGNPEEFLKKMNAWSAARKPDPGRSMAYEIAFPIDVMELWRKKVGDKTADALVARLESPVLRCQFSHDEKPEQRLERVKRELAALPEDAPVETRRSLIRMKWSLYQRGEPSNRTWLKEIEEAAADESDPRLALEARMQFRYLSGSEREPNQADLLKLQALVRRVAASPIEADREFASRYDGYFGGSTGGRASRNRPVSTRWGTAAQFSYGGSGRPAMTLPALIAIDDRNQALRETAKFLENAARRSPGGSENLRDECDTLAKAGLLDGALDRISLPPDAGLVRRVALLGLMDAGSKPDRARSLLAGIAEKRPWETRWTLDLALRSQDNAETRSLLDRVAERDDFESTLRGLLVPRNREAPAAMIAQLMRLADWVPQSKGSRGWIGDALVRLAVSGNPKKDKEQVECFRRYVKLALDDPGLAELGFRVMSATRGAETPETITDAARRALLAGAYKSDERTLPMQQTSNLRMELAALEHLVLVARDSGEDAAFPAEFRKQLKAVDPDSDAWLGRLLAAKTVGELPDVSDDHARSAGWVKLARHEAAMLRAVDMPGRDAWLTGIFREKKYQSLSPNLRHVIRGSLMDAMKAGTLPDRVIGLLEATAGPRKDWNKVSGSVDPFRKSTTSAILLPPVATIILNAATETDAATLLAVLDVFREAKVAVGESGSALNRLAAWWRKDSQPPRMATLAELLGKKRDAAYTLGVWQQGDGSSGIPVFYWNLPQILGEAQLTGQDAMVKAVKADPDASFLELLQAWLGSQDRTLQRRTLLKAMPDIARLPVEIRKAVIDALTEGMGTEDIKGLPELAASRLREQLDSTRKWRLEQAQLGFKTLKADPRGFAGKGYQIGSLLGKVIADDDAFVAEVLAAWRPMAEADKSGNEIASFANGLISNTGRDPRTLMAILRLLDSLWKGSPPAVPRNSNWGDPLQSLWSSMASRAMASPEFWKEVSTLSPKLQALFWLRSPEGSEQDFGADPKLLETIRAAAKGDEITRAALEWRLQCAETQGDSQSRIDGAALVGFAKVMKNAGAPVESIAALLCRAYQKLPRMENAALVMAETPGLLEGLRAFPENEGTHLFQGVQNLWAQVRRDERKATGSSDAKTPPAPVHPAETAALLKFAFTFKTDPNRVYFDRQQMTSMVLAIGDADLLGLWTRFAGKTLAGDFELIMRMLEQDRVAEAVALAPNENGGISTSRSFTAAMEPLVAKLRSDPSPRAFALRVRLSLQSDATGTDAPVEKRAERMARLTDEFERNRAGMTAADRGDLCKALGLTGKAAREHVPALDEFAGEDTAREYRKMLLGAGGQASSATLFIPAVCSRIHTGDLSGIRRLSDIVATTPGGERFFAGTLVTLVPATLITHLGRIEGKPPEASVDAILTYAKALAGQKTRDVQGIASLLVHLAETDEASLAAALKDCGLEGVKPSVARDPYGSRMVDPAALQTLLRMALLHPVSSEALLDALGPPPSFDPGRNAMLPLLADPKLRAKIPPARFLQWNRNLIRSRPEDLDALNAYATERRGDFDEAQLAVLDRLLERLRNPNGAMDPAFREELRRQQMEEMRRGQEEMRLRQEEMMRRMRSR